MPTPDTPPVCPECGLEAGQPAPPVRWAWWRAWPILLVMLIAVVAAPLLWRRATLPPGGGRFVTRPIDPAMTMADLRRIASGAARDDHRIRQAFESPAYTESYVPALTKLSVSHHDTALDPPRKFRRFVLGWPGPWLTGFRIVTPADPDDLPANAPMSKWAVEGWTLTYDHELGSRRDYWRLGLPSLASDLVLPAAFTAVVLGIAGRRGRRRRATARTLAVVGLLAALGWWRVDVGSSFTAGGVPSDLNMTLLETQRLLAQPDGEAAIAGRICAVLDTAGLTSLEGTSVPAISFDSEWTGPCTLFGPDPAGMVMAEDARPDLIPGHALPERLRFGVEPQLGVALSSLSGEPPTYHLWTLTWAAIGVHLGVPAGAWLAFLAAEWWWVRRRTRVRAKRGCCVACGYRLP